MRPRRLQEVPKGHLMKGAARAAVTVQTGAICQNRVVIPSCAPPRLPADADDFLNGFGGLIEEVRFAADSPVEGDGFEPSVPGCETVKP